MAKLSERRRAVKEFMLDIFEQADAFAEFVGDDKVAADTLESLKNCIAIHGVIITAAIREAEILRK